MSDRLDPIAARGGPPLAAIGPGLLLGILTLGAFTTALNVTLLSPLLTRIAAEFGASEARAGQLATLTAASSGVTALIAAPWMDRYSRGAWIRFECALLALGSVLSAVAPGFGWLFAGRVVAGVGGAIIGANCLAAVADLYRDPARRNRGLGLINTGFTLGAVVGLPVLTQIADAAGWRWAIVAPAPLAVVVFAGSLALPRVASAPGGPLWSGWAAGYGRVFRQGETVWLLAAMVALMAVWFSWLIYFGAYAETVFGVGAGTLSLLFLAGGAAQVAANNLTPPLLRRRPPRVVASLAAAIVGVNLLLVGVAYTEGWTLFPFIAIGSAAGSVMFVSINILLLDSIPAARGAVMSLQSAGLELGGAAGVAVTGLALAALNDYEAVYRLVGLFVPLIVACLIVSTRTTDGTETTSS